MNVWAYGYFLLVEEKKKESVVLSGDSGQRGRDSLEAIKADIGLHICLRETNMDRKNRNKSIAVWRIHIEELLTELMITEMKRKISCNGE